MKVRIAFRADVLIEGETMAEVRRYWENLELFSQEAEDADVCFLDTDIIEDADTYEDLETEFYQS